MDNAIRWGEVEGVVFDAVGTLIEPTPPVAEAYARTARRQGVEVDPREIKARFRLHFRNDEVDDQGGPMATDEAAERRRWRRIVSNVLPELPDPDLGFAELWDHFGRAESWRSFPDVVPALAALSEAGFPVRIGSNFDGRLRGVVAGLEGLAGRAGPLVISSEVGFRKPHPRFYEAACEGLGLPPSRVLCVGDDAENDVRGPRRAGLQGLFLDRDAARPTDLPNLPDLDAVVARLLGRAAVPTSGVDRDGPIGR